MSEIHHDQNPASLLCVECGLCCTGHLFLWAKLRSKEVGIARRFGLNVLGVEPENRGFGLPCPLWAGKCPIHTSPDYPHACRTYKCKLLKRVMEDPLAIPDALESVRLAKEKIADLKQLLPAIKSDNFRERLVSFMEHGVDSALEDGAFVDLRRKAVDLIKYYEIQFGVKGLVNFLDETPSSI